MKYVNTFTDQQSFNNVKRKLDRPLLSLIKDSSAVYCLSEVDVEFVDLGLSVKWAKYNVGATHGNTKESWYGDYYAWGEIEPKESYSKSNYKWADSEYTTFTKYNDTDKLTTLQPEDDAAEIKQEILRMPTYAEMQELVTSNNLSNEWVTDYEGVTGLNGIKFTLKSDSTKYIFFPAAGRKLNSSSFDAGNICEVFSATRNNSQTVVETLVMSENEIRFGSAVRYMGRSVRGVKD